MKTSSKRKRENIPKHKRPSTSKPFLAYLPHEIIQDILCLLPVQTLIGFKCVCKSWFYLISNPQFVNTHLQKSNNYNRQRLVLSDCDTLNIYSLKLLSIDIIDNSGGGAASAVIDYPVDPHCPAWIVGSCNGLVCFTFDKADQVFLYNPSAKISKKLPPMGYQLAHYSSFGFGYDPLNDDNKVVYMSRAGSGKVSQVYSLKSNSWRNIGGYYPIPHNYPSLDRGAIYVNGILHWEVSIVDGNKISWIIGSFDLGNESYGEIAIPCFGDEPIASSLRLGVLDGCLSIFYTSVKPNLKEIWVMKEYGIVDTWIKLCTISASICGLYSPLCITMTGEILLKGLCRLVLYNPTNGAFRDHDAGKLSDRFEAITYVESLVSPNIDDEMTTPKSLLQSNGFDSETEKINSLGFVRVVITNFTCSGNKKERLQTLIKHNQKYCIAAEPFHASDELVKPRRSSRVTQAIRDYMA